MSDRAIQALSIKCATFRGRQPESSAVEISASFTRWQSMLVPTWAFVAGPRAVLAAFAFGSPVAAMDR